MNQHSNKTPKMTVPIVSETSADQSDSHALDTQPVLVSHVSSPYHIDVINILLVVLSAIITVFALILFVMPEDSPLSIRVSTEIVSENQSKIMTSQPATSTPAPTTKPIITQIPQKSLPSGDVPVDVVADLLLKSGATVVTDEEGLNRRYSAFTIAPVRPRDAVTEYTIKQGDTLEKIAAQFGISTDSLIWNNDGIYVNRLMPSDKLIIVPINGILHKADGTQTIQEIADKYKVNAYQIIDSEYNPRLQSAGATPSTILPNEYLLIVPGGVSEKKAVYWDPGTRFKDNSGQIVVSGSGSGVSTGQGGTVAFGEGAGACGYQPNGQGTGTYVRPLPVGSYTITQNVNAGHGGIDLSSRTGTTVFAADNGVVIFAGWSDWGYGNAVVLAHGNILTLYAHMSSVGVTCGQTVAQGTPIGAVGSTGNSSGSHLHFEIRPGGVPASPRDYLSF